MLARRRLFAACCACASAGVAALGAAPITPPSRNGFSFAPTGGAAATLTVRETTVDDSLSLLAHRMHDQARLAKFVKGCPDAKAARNRASLMMPATYSDAYTRCLLAVSTAVPEALREETFVGAGAEPYVSWAPEGTLMELGGEVLLGAVDVTYRKGGAVDLFTVPLPPHALIKNLRVAPGVRRMGVATALLEAAEAMVGNAAQEPLPWMYIKVSESNTGARTCYERAGYELSHVEGEPLFVKSFAAMLDGDGPEAVLRKPLVASPPDPPEPIVGWRTALGRLTGGAS